jgi:pilus assembly protein Flp/PilA
MKLVERIRRFIRSEEAPTATEYAVMLALIIVVALVAIQTLGQNVSSTFDVTAGKLTPGGGGS